MQARESDAIRQVKPISTTSRIDPTLCTIISIYIFICSLVFIQTAMHPLLFPYEKSTMVVLESNLSFEMHSSHVKKTAFFHLRNIAKLQNMLTVHYAEKLVHAFMTSRLDYCNALQGGCPASSINKLQIVQNGAVVA